MDDSTKFPNYEPTPAEEKLLETLLNPANRHKSVTEVCGIAGIDRKTHYNAFRKRGFVDLFKSESKALVAHGLAAMVNTFIREGIRGSFQHGKVILEMGGIYSERRDLRIDDLTKRSDEELRAEARLLAAQIIEEEKGREGTSNGHEPERKDDTCRR